MVQGQIPSFHIYSFKSQHNIWLQLHISFMELGTPLKPMGKARCIGILNLQTKTYILDTNQFQPKYASPF